MIAATVCSGIGAPEVAMPDWEYCFQSEIENFPREVLKVRQGAQDARYRRKDGPALWGDFTAIRVRFLRRLGITLPQWLIAGTPCQAFSIAGLRQSLEDDRGNLTLEFVRLVHSLRRAGALRGFTWENVPGVLSTSDNAFGCFLAAVVGADAPLRSPLEQGRWPHAGMVAGPWARIAWRLLDAQYCGLAQRRLRVIAVASFGDGVDPAQVLFERIGVRGNPAPRREKGQSAPTIPSRSTAGGGLGTDFDCDGGLIADWPAEVSPTLDTYYGDKMGLEDQHVFNQRGGKFVPGYCREVAASLTSNYGKQPDNSDTGLGPNLVATAYQTSGNCGAWETGQVTGALDTNTDPNSTVICFGAKEYAQDAAEEVAPTLRSGSHDGSHANGGIMPAVAFAQNQLGEVRVGAVTNTLNTNSNASGRNTAMAMAGSAVRRLTPRECERLQGFPDDWTLIPYRGKPAADGPRYKALGNSMAVPVMAWIGRRIAMVEQITRELSEAA